MSIHPSKKSNYLKLEQKTYEQHRLTILELFLDRIKDEILLVTQEGHLMYTNKETSRVLGYSRKELLAMSISDIDPNCHPERWSEHWESLKQSGTQTFETHHISKEGKAIAVEVRASFFEYEGLAYNLCIVHDITQRKQTEQRLKEKTEALEKALELIKQIDSNSTM